jgi:hypothetical protein
MVMITEGNGFMAPQSQIEASEDKSIIDSQESADLYSFTKHCGNYCWGSPFWTMLIPHQSEDDNFIFEDNIKPFVSRGEYQIYPDEDAAFILDATTDDAFGCENTDTVRLWVESTITSAKEKGLDLDAVYLSHFDKSKMAYEKFSDSFHLGLDFPQFGLNSQKEWGIVSIYTVRKLGLPDLFDRDSIDFLFRVSDAATALYSELMNVEVGGKPLHQSDLYQQNGKLFWRAILAAPDTDLCIDDITGPNGEHWASTISDFLSLLGGWNEEKLAGGTTFLAIWFSLRRMLIDHVGALYPYSLEWVYGRDRREKPLILSRGRVADVIDSASDYRPTIKISNQAE